MKYLATLLSPLTSSEYNLKNSYELVKSIKNTKIVNRYKMISFDNTNLFTNVPLDKTIKIILRNIYQERMLDTSKPQNYYRYGQNSYGGRIYLYKLTEKWWGPVLANIFMTELEIVMKPL